MNLTDTIPTYEERMLLVSMVYQTTLRQEMREVAVDWIVHKCANYKTYEMMFFKLESLRTPFNQINCPNQTDIKLFVRDVAKNLKYGR